jgi:uncharacterized protein
VEGGVTKIGLLADTHDRLPAIRELLRQMASHGVEMVLHAGDYCSPFSLKIIAEEKVSLAGVFGRNDGDRQGLMATAQGFFGNELFESPHSLELGGERILLVHDLGDVSPRSISAHDIVVHGCSHRQEMKTRGKTLLVNPGEGCGWLHGTPSAAVLSLETKQVEFLSLSGDQWRS